MPSITGLLESALYVTDLDRARRFYQELFGFEPMLIEDRLCALSVAGRQVLLLFLQGASDQPNPVPGGIAPPHGGDGRIESTVHAARGGTSLYFRDPDGHLVELATPGLWPIY